VAADPEMMPTDAEGEQAGRRDQESSMDDAPRRGGERILDAERREMIAVIALVP